ncbi:hypothetical protein F4781DRAFT_37845 [Annulohypoxylon bovei var. microspora]|nr:hypothetical protein F4781DRAFT_37845 [Annulohypoxylon bovei var. microspora]
MLFNVVSLLALGVVAAALPSEKICPHTKCFDAVNKCGIKYGRCYDMCSQEMPPPPPCPGDSSSATPIPTTTSPTTITSIPTTTLVPTTITSASACTSTGTACVDYLRTCGSPPTAILTFGGCFPACGPTPTYSPPSCPEPTTV